MKKIYYIFLVVVNLLSFYNAFAFVQFSDQEKIEIISILDKSGLQSNIEARYIESLPFILKHSVSEILKHNFDSVYNNIELSEFGNLLLTAVVLGEFDLVKNLIDKGMDINVQNKRGWTPLHLLVHPYYKGDDSVRVKMIEFFLSCSAKLDIKTYASQRTPFETLECNVSCFHRDLYHKLRIALTKSTSRQSRLLILDKQ